MKAKLHLEKLLQIPGVEAVSFSSDVPSSDNNWVAILHLITNQMNNLILP
jgi:hypothetical protein